MRKTCKNARKKKKITLSIGIHHLNSGYRKGWRNDLKINFPQHWKVQASRLLRFIVCPSVQHNLKPTVEKFQNTRYAEKTWRAWDPQNGWRENKEKEREREKRINIQQLECQEAFPHLYQNWQQRTLAWSNCQCEVRLKIFWLMQCFQKFPRHALFLSKLCDYVFLLIAE